MKGKEAGLFDNKALASLILPLLVEQFLAVLVGMADSIMVASVGEAAVSGVSLVDNVMVLFINLFAALATGGAVIAGQYLGQEDRRSSGKAATQLIWFMTAVSFGIMVLIYLGKNFILHQIFFAQICFCQSGIQQVIHPVHHPSQELSAYRRSSDTSHRALKNRDTAGGRPRRP